MLIKDLIEKDEQLKQDIEDDDCCGLCATHDAAYRILEKTIYCPHCGKPARNGFEVVNYDNNNGSINHDGFVAVGEWYADLNEEINMYPVIKCVECDKEYILVPQKVIHNYNHDVYYTGRKHILPKFNENDLVNKIKPSIQEYLDRYKTDTYLTASNLALWIARDCEKYVAEMIENNYKEIV